MLVAGPVSSQPEIDLAGTTIHPHRLIAGYRPRRTVDSVTCNIVGGVRDQPATIIIRRQHIGSRILPDIDAETMFGMVSIGRSSRSAAKRQHCRQRDYRSNPHRLLLYLAISPRLIWVSLHHGDQASNPDYPILTGAIYQLGDPPATGGLLVPIANREGGGLFSGAPSLPHPDIGRFDIPGQSRQIEQH